MICGDFELCRRKYKQERVTQDYENIAAIQVAADHWASQGKDVPQDYRPKVLAHL